MFIEYVSVLFATPLFGIAYRKLGGIKIETSQLLSITSSFSRVLFIKNIWSIGFPIVL